MTVERAKRHARLWALALVVAIAARITLTSVGFDLLSVPMQIAEAVCLTLCWSNIGWVDGYRAHQKETKP